MEHLRIDNPYGIRSIRNGITDSQSILTLRKNNIGIVHLVLGVPVIFWVHKAIA